MKQLMLVFFLILFSFSTHHILLDYWIHPHQFSSFW